MRKTERHRFQSSSLCSSPRTPHSTVQQCRLSELKARSNSRPRDYHQQKYSSTLETTVHWPDSTRGPQPATTVFNLSMLSSSLRMPKRTRIFSQLPQSYQHFTIGATVSNLQFDELDNSTLLCSLASTGKCGCEQSTRCCERILTFTNLSKTRQMKKKYSTFKELREPLLYNEVRLRMQDVPLGYPEILLPHVENLLRLIPTRTTAEFKLLLTVVWHARVEYLAYWIYNDLKRTAHNENFTNELLQMITDYSSDLKSYLQASSLNMHSLAHQFQESCGSAIIPSSQYARYLEALNSEGRNYPKRVLFCVLLHCKKKLCEGKLDLQSLFHRPQLANELPWPRIFSAAKSPKLK